MTRRRRYVHVDRDTGRVSLGEVDAPGDLSFAERVQHTEALVREQLPGPAHASARLVCDRCGLVVTVSLADPVAPEGWVEVDGRGDLCPDCQGPS